MRTIPAQQIPSVVFCLVTFIFNICASTTFNKAPIDTLAIWGNETFLQCIFNEFEPSYEFLEWKREKNPTDISSGPIFYLEDEYKLIGNYDDGEYILHILNVTSDDRYTCRAPRSRLEASADLIVLESGPSCEVYPGSTTVEGRNTTFTCTSIKGVPPGESVWTLNGVEESRKSDAVHSYSKVFSRDEQGSTLNCGIQHPTLSNAVEGALVCESDIILNIQYPPIVNVTNTTHIVVIQGDEYFAECQVQERGNPDVIDGWYWLLPNGTMYDNGTLAIYDATREDNGTYTCVAENKYFDNSTGYGNASIELSVHYEPEAQIYDVSNGKVIQGRNYKATCAADANPAATFSWISPNDTQLSNNSQLKIHDIQKENAGIYTCQANNVFFNGGHGYGNKSIEIDVQYKALVSAVIHGDASNDDEIIEGDSIFIECVVIDANPAEDTVSWSKDNDVTIGNWMNLTDVSRLDNGLYTCVANNTFWDNSTGTGIIDQRVDVQYPPEIHELDNATYAIEGRMFHEVCIARGNPTPNVRWLYNGNQVSQTATLQYEDIQRYQSGEYICEANNTFWNGKRGAALQTLQLDVQYPPTIVVASRHVRKEYESATFTCNAIDANPMNTVYTWLSSDEILSQGPELLFYNVTRDLTGDYDCIGNNIYYNGEHGTGRNTTYLDVQYGPEVEVEITNVRAKEGTRMSLLCSVDSNPPADHHNWTKDGVTVSSELTYTVEMVNRNDTGIYNCTAETTFYNDDVDIGYEITNVVVEYMPIVIILGPQVAVVEDIDKTSITCSVTDGIPDPKSIRLFHVNETVNQVDSTESQNGVTSHTFDLGVTQRWHRGSYYCEASTTFADKSTESGRSEEISVIVHYKQTVVVPIASTLSAIALVSVLAVLSVVVLRKRKQKLLRERRQVEGETDHHYQELDLRHIPQASVYTTLDQYAPLSHPNSDTDALYAKPGEIVLEFPKEYVRQKDLIGGGTFGRVFKAEAWELAGRDGATVVALKTIKDNATEDDKQKLMDELELLTVVGQHKHVLSLIGCCTKTEPVYMLLEYMALSNLQTYLRDFRKSNVDNYANAEGKSPNLSSGDLISFTRQIASAMVYLSSKKITHGDLAARNVMLNGDRICKVTNFGRGLDKSRGNGEDKKTLLPVRWMAPEALWSSEISTQSDVWSFGVVVWEIVTIGNTPYPGMSTKEVIEYLKQGNRMNRPKYCNEDLYLLMTKCWSQKPTRRTNFKDLLQELEEMERDNEIFVDIKRAIDDVPEDIQSIA